MPLEERDDVAHAERIGVHMLAYRLDEFEVVGGVYRPMICGTTDIAGGPRSVHAKKLGMIANERRHMLALGGQFRFAPRTFKRGEREHFRIQSFGIILLVSCIVDVRASKVLNHLVDDGRVNERTIPRHTDDYIGTRFRRGFVISVEYVVLVTSEDRDATRLSKRRDCIVAFCIGCREHDLY